METHESQSNCEWTALDMNRQSNKVLLVDDDQAMRRLVSKWLESSGYQVQTAENGREAIAAIEKSRPHILLTDWEMPVMDGISLCRWVREQQQVSYIYTILFTVRTSSSDIIQGLEAGADDFCKKPLDRDELVARLRSGARVIELEQRLIELAHKDPLTGVLSRGAFLELVEKELARSKRLGSGLSCVMLDVDQLKQINDKHGHGVGDEVLRQVAQQLVVNARAGDYIGRYGSEEFCAILPESREGGATQWAERIRGVIKDVRIPLRTGGEFKISASFGAAEKKEDTRTVEQLLDMAEQAMLVSKRSGRDRVASFGALTAPPAVDQTPAELLQNVPARIVMSLASPLQQDETLGSASQYFLRFRINSAPVVDAAGNLAGILSEKDVMTTMLRPDWHRLTVANVMQKNVVFYDEETPAMLVYEFLCRVTIRSVVIVKDGKPTGLINRGSLIRFFSNLLAVDQMGLTESVAATASQAIAAMTESTTPRQRLSQLVRSVACEAADLARRIQGTSPDLLPSVVGGASRLQELVKDMLLFSRFAKEPADAESGERETWSSLDVDPHLERAPADDAAALERTSSLA
jgi:two-component system, cell cycle response regulator